MGNLQENTTQDDGYILFDGNDDIFGFDPAFETLDNKGDDYPYIIYDDYQYEDIDNIWLSQSVFEDFISPIGDDVAFEFYSQSDNLFLADGLIQDSIIDFDYTFNDFETKSYPKINWVKQQPASNGWVKLPEVS